MKRHERYGSRNTTTGEPCNNLDDSGPHPAHRRPDERRPVLPTPPAPLPGVAVGAPGLAGDPEQFAVLVERALAEVPTGALAAVRDYWLTACLYGIATSETGGAIRSGRSGEIEGRSVFSGGTSLVSAWGIADRYSEDLDLLSLSVDPAPPKGAVRRLLRTPDTTQDMAKPPSAHHTYIHHPRQYR